MTREEALMSTHLTRSEVIDKIFDDFESRTCENCSMYTDGFGICTIAYDTFERSEDLNKSNFSCNNWEAKDE